MLSKHRFSKKKTFKKLNSQTKSIPIKIIRLKNFLLIERRTKGH